MFSEFNLIFNILQIHSKLEKINSKYMNYNSRKNKNPLVCRKKLEKIINFLEPVPAKISVGGKKNIMFLKLQTLFFSPLSFIPVYFLVIQIFQI